MKTSIKAFGLIIIAVMSFCFTSKGQITVFDMGHVEYGVYKNNYFNFKIMLPNAWYIQTPSQDDNTSSDGSTGDSETIMDASEVSTANLLEAFQYKVGTEVEFNPSILIGAENIMDAPEIKNGNDFLLLVKDLIVQEEIEYDYVSDEIEYQSINGTDFYKMVTRVNYNGVEIEQNYYSTVSNGFCFNIIISFNTGTQKEILLRSINTMIFLK